MKNPKNSNWEYNEGYEIGLNNLKIENPYGKNTPENENWQKGYNEGWRNFINWVNLMCN